MSVWPSNSSTHPALRGSDGILISVSIPVEPRWLEDLLEALAQLDFPINPQIYHDAAVVHVYADGQRQAEPITIVEFPAYASRLPEIRQRLSACGFPVDSLRVTEMLEEMHTGSCTEPAPSSATYKRSILMKRANRTAAGA